MEYLAVCTFELRNADASQHELAYNALRQLGFRHGAPANLSDSAELPADAVVGSFEVTAAARTPCAVAFLRNCLSYKLREVFGRHGLDAEFLLVVSRGDLAWERGGYRPADFASRHARGALVASGG